MCLFNKLPDLGQGHSRDQWRFWRRIRTWGAITRIKFIKWVIRKFPGKNDRVQEPTTSNQVIIWIKSNKNITHELDRNLASSSEISALMEFHHCKCHGIWHRYSKCKSATCCSWRTPRQPWGSWWCQTSTASCCSLFGTFPKSMQTSTHQWKMGHPTGWTTNWLWPCSAIRPSEKVPLSDEHWRWRSPSHWSSLVEWAQGTCFSRPEWRFQCHCRGQFCKQVVPDSVSNSWQVKLSQMSWKFPQCSSWTWRQVLLWPNLPEEHLACQGLAAKGVFLFWQRWKPIWTAKANYPGPVCVVQDVNGRTSQEAVWCCHWSHLRHEFPQWGVLWLSLLLKLVEGVCNIPVHLLLTINAVANWTWKAIIPLIKDQQSCTVGCNMGQGQWRCWLICHFKWHKC